jgi:hypothetical protein
MIVEFNQVQTLPATGRFPSVDLPLPHGGSIMMDQRKATLISACISAAAVTFQATKLHDFKGDKTPEVHAKAIMAMAKALCDEIDNTQWR